MSEKAIAQNCAVAFLIYQYCKALTVSAWWVFDIINLFPAFLWYDRKKINNCGELAFPRAINR